MHRFKDLEIWKRSKLFCSEIYKLTAGFPESEKFGLTNQLRRASVSLPSNIAEGSLRKSNKDFSRFLEIILGPCAYCLQFKVYYRFLHAMSKELEEIIKMISKFKSTLKV